MRQGKREGPPQREQRAPQMAPSNREEGGRPPLGSALGEERRRGLKDRLEGQEPFLVSAPI